MSICITKYCHSDSKGLFLNGEEIYKFNQDFDFSINSKNVYKYFEINYPKFFKMDNLSKLFFINTELLITKSNFLSNYESGKIGVAIQNSSSSLDTDEKYFQTIADKENYYPGPALFVYTLPNIMIGEICIRYGISGENVMMISEMFKPNIIVDYIKSLIDSGRADAFVGGWAEYYHDKFESFLFLAEKIENNDNFIELSSENIEILYNKRKFA